VFEDQTVELLPARTTMKVVGHRSVARMTPRFSPHLTTITVNVLIQYFNITNTQVSLGDNSPNVAIISLANGG
jgi:hypothetical protein